MHRLYMYNVQYNTIKFTFLVTGVRRHVMSLLVILFSLLGQL